MVEVRAEHITYQGLATKKPINRFSKIMNLSIFMLFLITSSVLVGGQVEAKESTLSVSMYLHDISGGPNATVTPVSGIPGKAPSFTQFGTVYVTDDNATETPDPRSPQIGRVQGTYVTSALDGSNTHVSVSIVFANNNKYNGSTLEIQGTSKQFEAVREVPVVGGTGKFRYARGYVTFETYSFDVATSYAVLRCNVSVLHYQF